MARLGQIHDSPMLFNSQAVRNHVRHLDQTSQILDCGVGTGAFSLALLDSIDQPAHVSGVDISAPMLPHAQYLLSPHCTGLDLRQGDIRYTAFCYRYL